MIHFTNLISNASYVMQYSGVSMLNVRKGKSEPGHVQEEVMRAL